MEPQTLGTGTDDIDGMKVLVDQFDWSTTPLGDRTGWSPLLRSTVRLCLDSKLPIIIFWGNDLSQIYNDAHKELLGGKHNGALGGPARETWAEVWENFSLKMLPELMMGKSMLLDNVKFMLNRRGYPEEAYFMATYTPIMDDEGNFQGIFITSNETTSIVINEHKLRQLRNEQLKNLFLQAPLAMCILKGRDFVVEIANDRMLEIWGKSAHQMLNKPLFEGLSYGGGEGYENLLTGVYNSGVRAVYDEMGLSLIRNGKVENVFVKLVYEALREENGKITGIMVLADEITEQVQSRKKTLENEERLKMAIQATNLGTWDYHPLSGELTWSEECKKIYALPPDVKIDFNLFSQLLFPADKAFVEKEINHAMDPEEGGEYDITYRILRYDNKSVRWIRSRGKVYFNNKKEPERFFGTVVDISVEKQFEETLRKNELRIRLALEAAEMGAFDWDIPNSTFQYSERLARMFGFTHTKGLVQKNFADRIHPDDQATRAKAHSIAFARGSLFYEARIIWPDSSIHWVRLNGKVLYDDAGKPLRMYGTTLDITDQKTHALRLEKEVKERTARLEENNAALQRSEERYHKMIDGIQDYAIILLDRHGIIENWNKGAEKIKQYKETEIIGKHFGIFYLPEDRKNNLPQQVIDIAVKNGKAGHEGWRLRKDGTSFWGSITINALLDSDNNIIGFSKITRDLTDKKSAEDKLLAYTTELESQNRELEQFAYVSSHDLQEPIRKIQTFADIIHANLGDENLVNRYFEKINSSAQRMSELIKSVLNYSRLARDGDEMVPVNLNVVMSGVESDFELLLADKKARIIHEDLPTVKGNPLQLSQLFSNLISNSLKFTEKDPVIEIKSRVVSKEHILNNPRHMTEQNYIEISFKDNGIGFDQQYDKKIFTMFQRLHGKQDYAGTGIGLALCKKITENHNGYIAAKSALGKGSTFYLYIPA
ncbi:MAG: PAS domain S-box protein [Cyclobacteriaceae bacterium]